MSVELVRASAESEGVYNQEFTVRYDYPVHFTEHLFARYTGEQLREFALRLVDIDLDHGFHTR